MKKAFRRDSFRDLKAGRKEKYRNDKDNHAWLQRSDGTDDMQSGGSG